MADLPFPQSRCHGCIHLRLNTSAHGTTFMRCAEGSLPKYQPQPVRSCARFAPPAS